MANRVWLTTEGVPFLNGLDYELWKVRMVAYLMALDVDMWLSILNEEKNEHNEEAQNIIMKGISKLDADKVRYCELVKEVLERLRCLYEGHSHVSQEKDEEPCCFRNESEHAKVVYHHIQVDDEEFLEGRSCCSEGKLFLCDKWQEIGTSLYRCTCVSLNDRDSYPYSNCNEDRPTLVAMENEESLEKEERFLVCSSIGENENTLGSDEGITIRPMEDSKDIEMALDPCGNSANTSNSEENDLDERIFFRERLMLDLKEIKFLSEENSKKEEKLKIYKLKNGKLRRTMVELNGQ